MSGTSVPSVFVQSQGKVLGPWPIRELHRLPGFSSDTLVSFPDSEKWAPAYRVFNLKDRYISRESLAAVAVLLEYQLRSRKVPEAPSEPSEPRILDFSAQVLPGWSDRWFRRLFVLNLLLAGGLWCAWRQPAGRRVLQESAAEIRASLPAPARARIARGTVLLRTQTIRLTALARKRWPSATPHKTLPRLAQARTAAPFAGRDTAK